MKFCAASPTGDDLDAQFASLSLETSSLLNLKQPLKPLPKSTDVIPTRSYDPTKGELSTILYALRKLREAITATGRKDQFAQRAYIFNVHAAILCKDWESYTPALNALLNVIHPVTPLSSTEIHEILSYTILDLACRRGDLSGAHDLRVRHAYTDRRVELILKALVADNWVMFWKMKKAVDGYQRRIVEFAEQGMRVHALKCLGRGYMSAERGYVERVADKKWEGLVGDGVGWELTEFDKVIIKTPKGK
jgi:hypothetical protein